MPANSHEKYAGFFVRFFSYLIDISLIFILTIPVRASLTFLGGGFINGPIFFNYSIKNIFIYLLTSAYFILFTYFNGATLGKMAMGVYVTKADETPLSFMDCLIRETFAKYLSAFIVYAGYLMIGADKEKRGLHDRICDTCVLYKGDKNTYHRKNTPGDIVYHEEN